MLRSIDAWLDQPLPIRVTRRPWSMGCLSSIPRTCAGSCVALLPDLARVDDVFQETFLTVSAKAEAFDPERDFLAWACGKHRRLRLGGRPLAGRSSDRIQGARRPRPPGRARTTPGRHCPGLGPHRRAAQPLPCPAVPDGVAEGTLRWGLSQQGELRLAIAKPSGRRAELGSRDQPALRPERFGQWVLLAATFDGHSVCHFVDGEIVKSGRAVQPGAAGDRPRRSGRLAWPVAALLAGSAGRVGDRLASDDAGGDQSPVQRGRPEHSITPETVEE